MTQLTRDQTFLNYLRDIGADVPADPEKDSRKGILTQAVGSSETLEVKVTHVQINQGDRILVCCDGLYNMVPEADLLEIASRGDGLADNCKAFIEKANANGGTDNITMILAEFSGQGLSPSVAGAAVECKEFAEEDFRPQT
jgi:protein phosphatase